MTNEDLQRETRLTVSVEEAARALGIGHTSAWKAIRDGSFPVRPIRVGRCVRIPTLALKRLCMVEGLTDGSAA